MQVSDFIHYMEDPKTLDPKSVEQLQKLVEDFPYFQSAHLLLSMASKKWDASVYQQSLKKTAIVSTSRAHLFQLIQGLENEEPPAPAVKAISASQQVVEHSLPPVEQEVAEQQADQRHELAILKATELSTELPAPLETVSVETKRPDRNAEENLEEEIQKSIVVSFVEKEILKTPELHKPKPVEEEPESFVAWLSLMKKNNGQPNQSTGERPKQEKTKAAAKPAETTEGERPGLLTNVELAAKKEKQKALIDRIIENNPGIIRNKEEQKFFNAELKAKESLLESEHLVTETLARIYALQGSVNKAVRAYEILSLKFPQKSAYFATLIQKLKNNL